MYYRIVRVVHVKETQKGNFHIILECEDNNGKTFGTAINRRHRHEANQIKKGDFVKV